jgi:microcystin-dependent protein
MPTLSITKNYTDGQALTKSHLDTAFDSISTFLNTTKIDADNIQNSAVDAAQIASSAVTTAKIAATAVTAAKLASDVTAQLVPTGAVLAWAGGSAPTGFLLCDGSAVSRTTYATLFAAISTAHGSGDGATTFNVPDYRGRFLRGVDGATGRDPDAADRTAMASGGNTGDNVGSIQADATAKNGLTVVDPGHEHTFTQYQTGFTGSGVLTANSTTNNPNTNEVDVATTGITLGDGDDETRPLNAYVKYIIKT